MKYAALFWGVVLAIHAAHPLLIVPAIAATLVGLQVIYAKALRPGWQSARRTVQTVDAIHELAASVPLRLDELERGAARREDRLTRLEEQMALLAEAERRLICQRLSCQQRER